MPDNHLPTLPRNRENDRLRARIVELEAEVAEWKYEAHLRTVELGVERDHWKARYDEKEGQ
jgi:hypothetical protein